MFSIQETAGGFRQSSGWHLGIEEKEVSEEGRAHPGCDGSPTLGKANRKGWGPDDEKEHSQLSSVLMYR